MDVLTPPLEGGPSPDPGGSAAARSRDLRYRVQHSAIDIVVLFVVLQIGSIIYAKARPAHFAFLVKANLETALQTIPYLGVAALGVGILMIAGEFDLSVGANYVVSSMVMAQFYAVDHVNVWLALLIGLAFGVAIGLLNGIITLKLKIPSFIATLGTLGIWQAGVLYIHGASSQTFTPPHVFTTITAGTIAGVLPVDFVWFIGLAVLAWALLQRHWLGNHIFAAGGGSQAATATGVRVFRAKLLAFAIAGGCGALAGALAASSVGNVSPTDASDLALQAIAACVIGGLLLAGGRGTIVGIVLGACLIYWIQDVILLSGAPGYYLTAFVGALIIAAAVLYQNLQARRA